MKAYDFPRLYPRQNGKKVAVIGGGNVAMDAARTAKRLGADEVYIVYRRSEKELPARLEEIHHAKEEGIILKLLAAPVKILGENGWVTGMECVEMELGEPDASAGGVPLRKKRAISFFRLKRLSSRSAEPESVDPADDPRSSGSKWGGIVVDEATMKTSQGERLCGRIL